VVRANDGGKEVRDRGCGMRDGDEGQGAGNQGPRLPPRRGCHPGGVGSADVAPWTNGNRSPSGHSGTSRPRDSHILRSSNVGRLRTLSRNGYRAPKRSGICGRRGTDGVENGEKAFYPKERIKIWRSSMMARRSWDEIRKPRGRGRQQR
jgi:hypothetical protein